MKRKLALILAVFVLFLAVLPMQALAADDQGFKNALVKAKSIFNITEDYTLSSYDLQNYTGDNVWAFSWTNKDSSKGSINVSIDTNGVVRSYYKYSSDSYRVVRKLPALSRAQAVKKAGEFIKNVNPSILPELKLSENYYNNIMESEYYINYYRQVSGVPFYSDTVNLSLNRDTGEVLSYNLNWTFGIPIPDKSKAIDIEKAKNAYKEKLGLRLVYRMIYDENGPKAQLVYAPRYGSQYVIDAVTGEKLQLNNGYYADGQGGKGASDQTKNESARAEQVLTPEEIEAINEMSKLITSEEAETTARNSSFLGLNAEYKLNQVNLYKNWQSKNSFTWSLQFEKQTGEGDNKIYNWTNVAIDAKTSEILGFNISYNIKDTDVAVYDEAASKQKVDQFLKDFLPARFNEYEYDENNFNQVNENGKQPLLYYFRMVRTVDGILVPDNSFSVTFDAVNGRVTDFNANWYDIEFPKASANISADKAYNSLFNTVGYELQYVLKNDRWVIYKTDSNDTTDKQEVLLVYAPKPGKPLWFDTETGTVLDYDGKPYKEIKPVSYTDIKGNFAEEKIKVLAEFGIALEGTAFRPNDKITQKEFFILLSKTLNYYYAPAATKDGSTEDIDNLYGMLENEGIVKAGEKVPNAALTKQDAVKFIIRALKYDKVAEIKGIYKLNFKDASKIGAGLEGYMAIAKGLGIISGNGGYLNPTSTISRAQAMIIIYNYLQI